MSSKGKTAGAGAPETVTAAAPASAHAAIDQAAAAQGRRARSSFMLKNFVDRDWIMKNVVALGKDATTGKYPLIPVGRVFGIVSSTSIKKGTLPDGQPSESVVLHGIFETESSVDGEVSAPTSLYLPNSFAGQIAAIFANDANVNAVKIDVDIAVEATGKGIPYAWVVTNYLDMGKSPLEEMKGARKRPALPSAVAPKQLTAG